MRAFNYFGSKNQSGVQSWIISNLPTSQTYVEPFGGSAAILLNKPKCDREIYSDIYDPAFNFFFHLKLNGKQLINRINELIAESPIGSGNRFVKQPPSAIAHSIDEAAHFWLYCHFSWCGGGTRWSSGFSPDAGFPNPWELHLAQDRLQDVELLQRDAIELIDSFPPQDPEILFYVDPPYTDLSRKSKDSRAAESAASRRQYAHEMTDDQHVKLAKSLEGRVAIVSGYKSALYFELYQDWEVKSFRHANDAEYLWISPQAMNKIPQLSLFGVGHDAR